MLTLTYDTPSPSGGVDNNEAATGSGGAIWTYVQTQAYINTQANQFNDSAPQNPSTAGAYIQLSPIATYYVNTAIFLESFVVVQ
ncbi:MAG: hypothetical protein E6K70_06170 [Planctomycetota bacterium]|nr:MAG: hypothetical protein E6K70_06170 [Planctomycetota bacterium]